MKRLFYTIVLWLGLLPVFAQQKDFTTEAVIGVRGGVNCTSISFMPEIEQDLSLHPDFGVMARYVSEKLLGIQGEINFSQRGWKENTGDSYSYSHTLNYIEVPVLAHIYFGKSARFFVNLGPEISYLLSESSNSSSLPSPDPNIQHANADKKFEYGICAGGGFEHCIKKFRYAIEGRYYFGLGDIFKNGTNSEIERSSNRIISVNLIFMTSIKK